MSFLYTGGDVTTDKPWKRPSIDRIQKWWSQFKLLLAETKLECYITGGVLNQTETWDVDIILKGEYKNNSELKFILDNAKIIGFELELLIDICYSNTHALSTSNIKPYKIRSWKTTSKESNGQIQVRDVYPNEILTELDKNLYRVDYIGDPPDFVKARKKYTDAIYTKSIEKIETFLKEKL